ncbi:hypothetical protein JW962_02415 [Candidatus Dojkabacteria bacterium]|nr:hypothetical protein [Candidatus Dojkabacteria bacterium]
MKKRINTAKVTKIFKIERLPYVRPSTEKFTNDTLKRLVKIIKEGKALRKKYRID